MTVNELIGIPWLDRGRSLQGCDCWGLIYLAYKHLYQIMLPTFTDASAADVAEVARMIDTERGSPWTEVDVTRHRLGDVALFRQELKVPTHVGFVTGPWRMLHIIRNGTTALGSFDPDSNRGRLWHTRLAGVYRHQELNL